MPKVVIPGVRLRENNIRNPQELLRVYAPALLARGFRLREEGPSHKRVWVADPPAEIVQAEEYNVHVSQTVPGRIPNNDPRLWSLLQRIATAESTVPISLLINLLASEGDDRLAALQAIEITMPESLLLADDSFTQSDGHSDKSISSEQMALRLLCSKILLLFGLREEPL